MIELQCGDFVRIETDVNTGFPRWRAQLTPAPLTQEWQDALGAEESEARQRGVYLGEGAIGNSYRGGFWFQAPEGAVQAIVQAIREIVAKANTRMAEREARDAQYGRAHAPTGGPLWATHLGTMAPTVLYHYTTQRGLLGIVERKVLWATNISYLADSAEFSGAFSLAKRVIEQARATLPDDLKGLLDQLMRSVRAGCTFVACFTEDGDLLSQWRAYCPDGGGVSLGLDSQELKRLGTAQRFALVKCIYNETVAMTLMREALDQAVSEQRAGASRNVIQDHFLRFFFLWAPTIKHHSFLEEREWRLVGIHNCDSPEIGYREGPTMIVPYYNVELCQPGGPLIFADGYLGPSRHPELANDAMTFLLNSRNTRLQQQLKFTQTPYRPR